MLPASEKAKGIVRMGQLTMASGMVELSSIVGTEYAGGDTGTPGAAKSCVTTPTSRKAGSRSTTRTVNLTARLDDRAQTPHSSSHAIPP